MNPITRKLATGLKPVAVLVAYEQENGYGGNTYYLESRRIDGRGNMGAGKPVSRSFIHKLADAVSNDFSDTPYGEIPRRMLYADTRRTKEKYVWYSPPGKRYMYFRSDLNIPNGEYFIPGLVWCIENSELELYAFRSKRITGNTQLYTAPFFNVSAGSHKVCLGNAKLDKPGRLTFTNLMEYWEKMFFLSEFSHILHSNPVKGNLVSMTKNSTEGFDLSRLIPCRKLKVKDLFR